MENVMNPETSAKALRPSKKSAAPQPADLASDAAVSLSIETDAAEAFIAEKRIGQRIRALRLKKSMGLVELGNHTGLSASFLSQLETGRVVPTLRNLARIAMVFSKDLTYFFQSEPQTLFRPHLAKDRIRLPQTGVDEPMYFFESLGFQVPDRQMDPYLAEFQPKPGKKPRTHHHAGCEFLYVLEGRLTVQHGDVEQEFGPGDAVYFDAATLHSYTCTSETPATAIIVTLPLPTAGLSASNNSGIANNSRRYSNVPLTLRNEPATARRAAQ